MKSPVVSDCVYPVLQCLEKVCSACIYLTLVLPTIMMDEGHYLSKPEASMYDIAIGLAISNSALFTVTKVKLKNQLIISSYMRI